MKTNKQSSYSSNWYRTVQKQHKNLTSWKRWWSKMWMKLLRKIRTNLFSRRICEWNRVGWKRRWKSIHSSRVNSSLVNLRGKRPNNLSKTTSVFPNKSSPNSTTSTNTSTPPSSPSHPTPPKQANNYAKKSPATSPNTHSWTKSNTKPSPPPATTPLSLTSHSTSST